MGALFYIKHHFQSIFRSKSLGGEAFALFILLILGVNSFGPTISGFEQIRIFLEGAYGTGYAAQLTLIAFLCADLLAKALLRRPSPKFKYYVLLGVNQSPIAAQYLFTSLFGIIPFLLLFPQVAAVVKAHEWLGIQGAVSMTLLLFSSFYLALGFQYSSRKLPGALIFLVLAILLVLFLNSVGVLISYLFIPLVPAVLLLAAIAAAYSNIKGFLAQRKSFESNKASYLAKILPSFDFKNALFQLEWALVIRNKRTRSNILMGLVSIAILPFLLKDSSPFVLSMFIFLVATSFFIIQHGVYSLGWEGNFFDFLITNFSPTEFLQNRRKFYLATCMIGFLICLIPTIIRGTGYSILISAFVYNMGVTIPLTLYRSLLNKTKIDLDGSSLTNYSGMLTGPIVVSSMLIIGLPFLFYGLGLIFYEPMAEFFPGLAGLFGLIAWPKLLAMICSSWAKRKYELSQSFKS